MGMFCVKFQWCDAYSHGKWTSQECTISAYSKYDALNKCKEMYGLGIGCDYKIISIEEV